MTAHRPSVVDDHLAELLDDLLGPRLPARPLCAGHAPLFDAELWGEPADQQTARHHRAITLCRRCPALAACTALLDDLPANATGIWAGRLLGGPRRGRPPTKPAQSPDPMDVAPAAGPLEPPRQVR